LAETRSAPERPSDVLNGKQRFLPVSSKDHGFLLLEVSSIVWLTVPADVELGATSLSTEDLAAEMAVSADVELKMESGDVLKGTLVYLQPAGKRRLQDFLQDTAPFFALRDGLVAHIVNSARIVWVRSLAARLTT
jgi:hypothetical protein